MLLNDLQKRCVTLVLTELCKVKQKSNLCGS